MLGYHDKPIMKMHGPISVPEHFLYEVVLSFIICTRNPIMYACCLRS